MVAWTEQSLSVPLRSQGWRSYSFWARSAQRRVGDWGAGPVPAGLQPGSLCLSVLKRS